MLHQALVDSEYREGEVLYLEKDYNIKYIEYKVTIQLGEHKTVIEWGREALQTRWRSRLEQRKTRNVATTSRGTDRQGAPTWALRN